MKIQLILLVNNQSGFLEFLLARPTISVKFDWCTILIVHWLEKSYLFYQFLIGQTINMANFDFKSRGSKDL